MALAGLTYHVVDPQARKFCTGSFHLPGSSHMFREYHNEKHGYVDLDDAIARSCDVYFYGLADELGVDRIATFLAPFGFGTLTGIDISGEKPGLLPSPEWKAKTFSARATRSGSRARRSTSASARATCSSRRCSWRTTPRSSPSAARSSSRAWSPRTATQSGKLHAVRAAAGRRGRRRLGG